MVHQRIFTKPANIMFYSSKKKKRSKYYVLDLSPFQVKQQPRNTEITMLPFLLNTKNIQNLDNVPCSTVGCGMGFCTKKSYSMFAFFHPLLCLYGMINPCHSGMPMQNPDTQIQIKFLLSFFFYDGKFTNLKGKRKLQNCFKEGRQSCMQLGSSQESRKKKKERVRTVRCMKLVNARNLYHSSNICAYSCSLWVENQAGRANGGVSISCTNPTKVCSKKCKTE